ncbi:MAG: hypothetical protein LQ344_001391 [Seirophora lacunosa]|nr:MAG: hypothetical protein LQ344_001391 [Seirophora lacunosa]
MPPKPKRQQQKKGTPAPPAAQTSPPSPLPPPPPAPGPPAAGPRRSARQAAQRAPEPEGSNTSHKRKATATTPTTTATTATTTKKKEKDSTGDGGKKKRQHEEEGEIDVSGTKGKKKKRGGKKRQLEEEGETDVSGTKTKKRKMTETEDEVRKEEKVVEEDKSGASKKTAKKSRPPPIKTGARHTIITAEERAITDLHSLRRVTPTAEAKYPSPYVNTDGLWKIENEQDMPMLVKQAFSIVQRLQRPPPDTWPEGAAFAAWYRRCDTGPHFAEGEISVRNVCAATWIAAYGQIIWDDLVCSAQAAGKRCEANAPRTQRAMEVFREGEAEAAKYFLVWENDGEKQVRVNGQLCEVADTSDKFLAIGPLPNYAIIEVEETIIFWFRNREALEYETAGILEARAQKRIDEPKIIDQQEEKGTVDDLFNADEIGSNPDPDLMAEVLQTEEEERAKAANREAELQKKEENRRADKWFKIFMRGLAKHSPAYSKDPDRSEFQRVKTSLMLEDTDVVLGIASVWEPLRSRDRHFAFNEGMNYQYARFAAFDEENQSAPKIEAAVHTDHDLIIPVVLDSRNQSPPNSAKANPANGPVQERNKEPQFIDAHGVGDPYAHIVLAFAQRKADDKVNIVIQDSRLGTVDFQRLQESVRKTICQIGWRDRDTQGYAIPLDMEPACSVEQPIVPAQEGTNMCGTYVILNAWVHMLGLPPLGKTQRPPYNRPYTQGQDRFVPAAMRVVNCALAGHMDLLTIQAFLNHYGYCELQDPDDANVRWPEDATARMTNYILHTLLDHQRRNEQTQLVDSQAMAEKTGCSLEIARLFLEPTEWKLEHAIALYRETYPDTTSPS